MHLTNSTALVTGANRGLGRHLTRGLLDRDAAKVYVTGRDHDALAELAATDDRLVALVLDVTDPDSVAAAADAAPDVTLLINNAGVLTFGDPLTATPADFTRDFSTNVIGPLLTTQAFAPILEANRGAVANVVTLIALAPVVGMSPYCASKAATHSLTQSLRAALAPKGVAVHGFYPAGIDTDMLADVEAPKEDPAAVAAALLDGIAAGHDDIWPAGAADPMAIYVNNPKELERMLTTG